MINLHNLPCDAIYDICKFLDWDDLLNLSAVSKQLYTIISSDIIWERFFSTRLEKPDSHLKKTFLGDIEYCYAEIYTKLKGNENNTGPVNYKNKYFLYTCGFNYDKPHLYIRDDFNFIKIVCSRYPIYLFYVDINIKYYEKLIDLYPVQTVKVIILKRQTEYKKLEIKDGDYIRGLAEYALRKVNPKLCDAIINRQNIWLNVNDYIEFCNKYNYFFTPPTGYRGNMKLAKYVMEKKANHLFRYITDESLIVACDDVSKYICSLAGEDERIFGLIGYRWVSSDKLLSAYLRSFIKSNQKSLPSILCSSDRLVNYIINNSIDINLALGAKARYFDINPVDNNNFFRSSLNIKTYRNIIRKDINNILYIPFEAMIWPEELVHKIIRSGDYDDLLKNICQKNNRNTDLFILVMNNRIDGYKFLCHDDNFYDPDLAEFLVENYNGLEDIYNIKSNLKGLMLGNYLDCITERYPDICRSLPTSKIYTESEFLNYYARSKREW